jgi:hypothetical protein
MVRDGVTTTLELEMGTYQGEDFTKWKEGSAQANCGTPAGHAWIRLAVPLNLNPKGNGLYSGFLPIAIHDGSGRER